MPTFTNRILCLTLLGKSAEISMAIEIKVPAPGESVSEVTIANWLVKEGEWVEMDAPLAEFESDKATFEVNAEKAGVIEKLIGNIGDTIAINTVIAVINTDAARPASAEVAPAAKTESPSSSAAAVPTGSNANKSEVTTASADAKSNSVADANNHSAADSDWSLVSPVAAQLLQQYNITPSQVKGTGAGGRVTKVDALEAIVAMGGVMSPTGGARSERREKMSNLRKTLSRRLVAVKNEAAMLTTFNEVNMKPIMDLRAQYKKKFEEIDYTDESYQAEKVDFAELIISENNIFYKDFQVKRIIFCQGFYSTQNSFFNWIPFNPAKGETILADVEGYKIKEIINQGFWIIPLEGHKCRLGSTYIWDNLDWQATESGRELIASKISKILSIPYQITGQEAGIRPTTRDRRPLMGNHPYHNNLYIFNGLGTKGVSLAPYFAEEMLGFLEKNKVLMSEANIDRFYSLYSL